MTCTLPVKRKNRNNRHCNLTQTRVACDRFCTLPVHSCLGLGYAPCGWPSSEYRFLMGEKETNRKKVKERSLPRLPLRNSTHTLFSLECLGGRWELEALELLDCSSLAKLSFSWIPRGLARNSSQPDWQLTIVRPLSLQCPQYNIAKSTIAFTAAVRHY